MRTLRATATRHRITKTVTSAQEFTRNMHTVFGSVNKGVPDFMQDLKKLIREDSTPNKVDLGAGVYRNEQGFYRELQVIRQAKKLLEASNPGHDYNPTTGIRSFCEAAAAVIFGTENTALNEQRIASVQTIAGTGANRIGAAFLRRHLRTDSGSVPTIYYGTPGWPNYKPLYENAGFKVVEFVYANPEDNRPNLANILNSIEDAEAGSIFVFQACCHNPTGLDYSNHEWDQLASAMHAKHHFAIFDTAYQGFGTSAKSGLEDDVYSIRRFVQQGVNLLVAQSFSKNMALYSERVGALHIVCASPEIAVNVHDQLRAQIRWEISTTPAYGARLVEIVLRDDELRRAWREELREAAARIEANRQTLFLLVTERYKAPGTWAQLARGHGLFSLLPLSKNDTEALIREHHVYLPPTGRINVAGLSRGNMEHVASAMNAVLQCQ